MVCIAAFIILALLSVFVAILSIFKRDLGKKYWKVFKKSWGCVGKKITLQKCETNFKDDVKNSILKKVIIKKPKLVKPISIGIEVAAVLIVFVAAWSLVEGAKAGLSLWTLGTCNVVHPSSCTLGAEVCSIDAEEPQNLGEHIGRWFADWGEIFSAVPDKFRSWDVEQFDFAGFYVNDFDDYKPGAVDIFDPGCIVCLQSFKNQLSSGFFDDYNVLFVIYPIQNPDGSYKFANSGIISRYVYATAEYGLPAENELNLESSANAFAIIEKIFTEYDDKHVNYQNIFNNQISNEEAETLLKSWLIDFGYSEEEVVDITVLAHSDTISEKFARNKAIVEGDINVKGIPTMIYDGRKHTGLFKAD